ncbi:MAG: tRNA lysidine(34) synthetase TilS [Planctomycetota bacterium]
MDCPGFGYGGRVKRPWLLAFSGGPDSVGLAVRLRDRGVVLAYVDHGLRGARAGRAERAAVERIANDLGLPLRTACVTVEGAGEAEARTARYAALERMAADCRGILLAQTADDRAEGILFALQRGTGLRGLAALRRRTRIRGVWRVRPALNVRRQELRRAAAALDPIEDLSNRATTPARSRLRHLALPRWAEQLGEDPVPLLCALADSAERVRGVLEERARRTHAGRRRLLAEPEATFPYLVEALRGEGPPLTRAAYVSLRAYLAAGRGDRSHTTPAGDCWRNLPRDGVAVSRSSLPTSPLRSTPPSRPSRRRR